MSTDLEKEDESVVDSSVTQKNDVGNLEDPDTSSHRQNEGVHCSQEGREKCTNAVEISCPVRKASSRTRYFIIKSLNHNNIQLSMQRGIWATQLMNEPILDEAFHNSDKVILVFSVNMSGFFQGYAQMLSSVGWRRDNVWSQGTGGSNPWGRSFKVKWLQLSNLPFHKTLHLKNPLNEYKPVKISRDCQELPVDIGEALCELIDRELDEAEQGVRDNFHGRWPGMGSACSSQNEAHNNPTHSMGWGRGPLQYPHLIQDLHHEAVRSPHALHQGSFGGLNTCSSFSPKSSWPGYAHQKGNITDAWDPEVSTRLNGWGSSGGEVAPLGSNISEDDFLEMSYEEYLEAHSGGSKRRSNPVAVNQDLSGPPVRGIGGKLPDETVVSLKAHKDSSIDENKNRPAASDHGCSRKRIRP